MQSLLCRRLLRVQCLLLALSNNPLPRLVGEGYGRVLLKILHKIVGNTLLAIVDTVLAIYIVIGVYDIVAQRSPVFAALLQSGEDYIHRVFMVVVGYDYAVLDRRKKV